MSNQLDVVRVNRTGALIRLHSGNQNLLNQPGMTKTVAKVNETTGRLVEIDGADHATMVAASSNLVRIGDALLANKAQREMLLTSALKLPSGEKYLMDLGVYDGAEDNQFIDPNTLHANNAGLPEGEVQVGIKNVTEELNASKVKRQPAKKAAAKKAEPVGTVDTDSLADL